MEDNAGRSLPGSSDADDFLSGKKNREAGRTDGRLFWNGISAVRDAALFSGAYLGRISFSVPHSAGRTRYLRNGRQTNAAVDFVFLSSGSFVIRSCYGWDRMAGKKEEAAR